MKNITKEALDVTLTVPLPNRTILDSQQYPLDLYLSNNEKDFRPSFST